MSSRPDILDLEHWDEQYESPHLPWETNRPSTELKRVLTEYAIQPCRVVELGCGTGTNAVWLASLGFEVTAIDLSPVAIVQARARAAEAGVVVRFLAADLTQPGTLTGPFDFFFDRGCYHAVRLVDRSGYFQTLQRITRLGTRGLVLTGNARESEDEAGPPVLCASDLWRDWRNQFAIIHLREFRFDAPRPEDKRYPGWSCLVERRV